MGRHKTIIKVELEKEEYLPEKGSIVRLSGKHINQFVGETYNHSVKMAWEWANQRNSDKNYKWNISLVDYYPQVFGGKAILVSYNISEKSKN